MGLAIFKRLQEGTQAVAEELPTPPLPPESYQSPAVRSLIDQVRQGILPDEALAEIQRDPTSLRSILAYGEGALGVGTLLAGGERLELPKMPMPEVAPRLPAGAGFTWDAKPLQQIQGVPKTGLMPEGRFANAGSASGAFSNDELTLMKQLVPDAFTENGVHVPTLHEGLAQSGPVVEVKKLGAAASSPSMERWNQIGHELDTRFPGWQEAFPGQGHPDEILLRNERDALAPMIEQENAASGGAQYAFVGPKPEAQMPGYVEGLVRLPRTWKTDASGSTGVERPMYTGPHFGAEDQNVLSSYRGYEEALPNGEKAFHVIEVQSDWGQEMRRAQEGAKRFEEADSPTYTDTNDAVKVRDKSHPLLPHYETLGLKAAIQHAKEIGATKVILPDAETAMMTEGHDNPGNIRYEYNDPDFGPSAPMTRERAHEMLTQDPQRVRQVIRQEGGMRLHYDQTLPSAMRKLTGDKGTPVDLGRHKTAEIPTGLVSDDYLARQGSPVFKDAAGNPKTNITGRIYDISGTPDEFTMTKAGYNRGTSVVRGYGPTHMYNT